jgi:hypothetical protein
MTGFLSEHTIEWATKPRPSLDYAVECFSMARRFERMTGNYLGWAKNWDKNSWLALFWAAEDGEI